MSAISNLIKGGAWLTLANVVSKLASALVLPVLARLLGPEALGIYSIVFSLAQSAQSFSSVGADIAMHRNGAQYKTIGTEAVGRLFGVGLALICLVSAVTGLGIWLFREPLAQHWLGQPNVTSWLGAAAILIVVQPFSNIPLLFLASLQDFRAYALRTSVEMIVTSAFTALLAWKWGLYGAILGLVIAEIVQIPWSYFVAKPVLKARGIRLRFDRFWQESRSILKFGFPYYFGNTLLGSLVGLPLMGLVSQYGGLEELGYLRVAQSMASLIGFIPSAIAPAAISYLSASSVGDQESHQYLKSVHLRSVWILLLIPICSVCLLIPNILNILYGSAYQEANILSVLSLWISLLVGVTSVLVQYLLAEGHTVKISWISTLGTVFFVVSAFLLVPGYQALGFLMAQIAGQLIGLPLVIYYSLKGINRANLFLLINLGILTCFSLIYTLVLPLFNLGTFLLWALSLFSIIILSLMIFFTGLTPSERVKLKKIISGYLPK
ncbi:MAG TPA: oligosaccharide flippase family protein [Phormidium sp.]